MKKWYAVSLSLPLAASLSSRVSAKEEKNQNDKDGVFYEIYVKSFYDSDGNGHGDLKGVIMKLDYLNDGNRNTNKDLQVNGLWLMPINTSPSYHKYDVTDYYSIDPEYGTLEDFHELTLEAHKRDVRVIIDLVINHTSSEHPWFIEASRDVTSKYHYYYVWSDEHTDLSETGSWGQQVWYKNPNGAGYYYGTFWSGMPDLNFTNPHVREELIKIGQYWLKQGADGFRLDAAMHIYKGQTTDGALNNLKWWEQFRAAMLEVKTDVHLVGEVWDVPEVVAPYYKSLDSAFNFDLASKIVHSVKSGIDEGIAAAAIATDELYRTYNPNKIDATFLTNHDQIRVMSEFKGDIQKGKSAASILLTLPGNPYLYYGEEIGMIGEKPDELIREPFRWYEGDGEGQTSWQTPVYNIGNNGISVEVQDNNENSLLNHYRKMIRIRQQYVELGKGNIESIEVNNAKVVAYNRTYKKSSIQIFHNIANETVVVKTPLIGKVIFASEQGVKNTKSSLTIPAHTTVLVK
ncbi:alpha-amylase [Niallia circulans]|uniref:Alpha-amylase n=1 Tax=Niallia circulans TaxID=1397 RepID=A0A553ST01_NIACI|nr:alpha-amylase family glycosyl hydrolase [Niallia circulans]TRZ40120.1 alpha-amylase [Niallia circulans]